MKYKRRDVVEVAQWFKNGDHPDDGYNSKDDLEGRVVRYYRHPEHRGDYPCDFCGVELHEHGWIDNGQSGETVCPGDYIIKQGDRYYCLPRKVFELVRGLHY